MTEAAEVIRAAATDETNIIFGATVDPRLNGQVWVTVVATGSRQGPAPGAQPLTRRQPLDAPSFLRDL